MLQKYAVLTDAALHERYQPNVLSISRLNLPAKYGYDEKGCDI